MNRHHGMSLSECLIGLFLALFMSAILLQFYVANKRRYVQLEEELTEQLELRWVTALITNSIRRAGFTPCLNLEQLLFEDEDTPSTKIAAITVEAQQLNVRRMNDAFSELIYSSSTQHIIVPKEQHWKIGQKVLIADCVHAEIQKIAAISRDNDKELLIFDKALRFTYSKHSYVGGWINESWFINTKTGTLYYKDQHVEEISPHIHQVNFSRNQGLIEGTLWTTNKKTLQFSSRVRNR